MTIYIQETPKTKKKHDTDPCAGSEQNSEYDQEIPQSQTADELPMALRQRGRATQQSQKARITNYAKQPDLSLPHQDDCKTTMDIKWRTTKT